MSSVSRASVEPIEATQLRLLLDDKVTGREVAPTGERFFADPGRERFEIFSQPQLAGGFSGESRAESSARRYLGSAEIGPLGD